MIIFAHSNFNRLIIHRVFKKERGNEHSLVDLEADLVEIDTDAENIIKKRLAEACGRESKAFKLQIANTSSGSFFDIAKNLWSVSNEEFIAKSRAIAILLSEKQRNARIPGGYLLIIDGTTDDNKGFSIVVKAELQEAFTTSKNLTTSKTQIELVTNLFMTPDKKFFKIGIIKQAINTSGETYPNSDFDCMLYDEQFSTKKKPAEYFYNDFLGFSIDKNDKILTKDFYNETLSVIYESTESNEDKMNMADALFVELIQNQNTNIDPRQFGETYLRGTARSHYSEVILSNDRFSNSFPKNTALMGRKTKDKTLEFQSNMKLKGPIESFDDNVEIINNAHDAHEALNDPTWTLVKIKGKPKVR